MKTYITENPQSALAKVYGLGEKEKSPYLNYYKKLEKLFGEPKACEESIGNDFLKLYREKIEHQHRTDSDNKLGTFYITQVWRATFLVPKQLLKQNENL
jgi:hypothetical protein